MTGRADRGWRAAVLGSPIGHSLSPALHRAAYAELGLDWTYEAYDVDATGLPGFLGGLDDRWVGLSLTMPLKAAVLVHLDSSTAVVEAAGGANTVLLREGRRAGDNTDVPGMVAALAAHGVTDVSEAAVLGGGATARSAVVALGSVTRRVVVYVRDPRRTPGLEVAAERSGVDLAVRAWDRATDGLSAALVVATTPSGATDHLTAGLPGRPGALFDVLYDPWPTPIAAGWAARGGQVIGGLELLVHQAVLQVLLMTGATVAAERLVVPMRVAGETALRTRPPSTAGRPTG
ncbi:MAG TPA: shikimate dehydrogenase [Actinomycetes bacterium]|nr:shikimate dehydrogenase [Actinomycetes bacterium]